MCVCVCVCVCVCLVFQPAVCLFCDPPEDFSILVREPRSEDPVPSGHGWSQDGCLQPSPQRSGWNETSGSYYICRPESDFQIRPPPHPGRSVWSLVPLFFSCYNPCGQPAPRETLSCWQVAEHLHSAGWGCFPKPSGLSLTGKLQGKNS